MKNLLVAKILYSIADILEIQDVAFKPQAYRNAARSIESLSTPIEEVADLDAVPGVGEHIAEKIKEIISTGRLEYYEKLKKEVPFDFEALMSVEGMGPKKIKRLHDTLGIKTVSDLKRAAEEKKIEGIPGFGPKSEEKILESIALLSKLTGRMLLWTALNIAEEIISKLKLYSKEITYAGSLRRMKEDIGDIDILAVKKSEKLIPEFMKLGEKIEQGPTKCSIHLPEGVQVDLRIIKEESYGAALQYFTGSKMHNVEVRKIAIKKGFKLNEYGLFKGGKLVAGRTENEVYAKLGLLAVPPELRENAGEIQLKVLPDLITQVRGDLQMHTDFSDGANTAEEMINACVSKGYEYLGLSDHVGGIGIANPLSLGRVKAQAKLIDSLRKKYSIKILHGLEVDIKDDGSLAIDKKSLEVADYVIGSVHSVFRKDATERLIKAVSNPKVRILAHPLCRQLGEREGISFDLERVFTECKNRNVFLEINAQPKRLDLSDVNARLAQKLGCSLIINTDAHSRDQLGFMRLGIATARRGWVTKDRVINALPWKSFSKSFLE